MPSVNTTTTLPTAGMTAADTGLTRAPTQQLGQDDFLKLLTVQMTQQDPMNPMEDTAFIAQMAQFTSLEQSNSMVKEMGYLRADLQLQGASNLIGKEVTVAVNEDEFVTGTVDKINADATSVYLNIDGVDYAYGQLVGVNAGTGTPATDPTTTSG